MQLLSTLGGGVLAGVTALAGLGGPHIEHNPTTNVAPIISPQNQSTVNPVIQPTTQQNPTLNSIFSPQINFYNGSSNTPTPQVSPAPSINNGDNTLNSSDHVAQNNPSTQPQQNATPSPPEVASLHHSTSPYSPSKFPRLGITLPQAFLMSGIGISAALYIFVQLRKLELFIQDSHNRWFSWKQDVPVVMFAQMPRIELAPELISAIQKRYLSTRKLKDFVSPLKVFLADLDEEKKALKKLVGYSKVVKALKLGWLLGVNEQYIEQAEEGLVRLAYIKHIFTSWCADFRIDTL